jgi:hypothetical protein
VDFSGASLSSATFQNVNLKDAKLGNITKVDDFTLSDSAWWEASEISAPLLNYLMDNVDPGAQLQANLTQRPTKDEYCHRVSQLFKIANRTCSESSIKFMAAPIAPVDTKK